MSPVTCPCHLKNPINRRRAGIIFDAPARQNAAPRRRSATQMPSLVPYLGHIVSSNGLSPDPAKLEIIKDWPQPTTLSALPSFIGMVQYCVTLDASLIDVNASGVLTCHNKDEIIYVYQITYKEEIAHA